MKSFKKLLEASITGKTPDTMALPYSNTLAQNVNTKEIPSGSNYGKEVTRYLKTTGLDNEREYKKTKYNKKGKPYHRGYAWCMAFVYTMFDDFVKKLGLPNPLPKTARVLSHWSKADPSLKIPVSEARKDPSLVKPGQVFFIRSKTRKGGGHTGIVTAVNVANKTYDTIEGNTNDKLSGEGDRVGRNTRTLSSDVLLGFVDYFKGNRNKKFEETVAEVVANAKTDYSPSEASGEEGMSKQQIKEVQRFLKSKGYYLGTFGPNKDGIDGDYGDKTKKALKDWKYKNNMANDSVLDKKVYDTIKKLPAASPSATDSQSTANTNTESGGKIQSTAPSLFPNKEITIDNFNISKDPNFEIKRAIVENNNSFKSIGDLLNEDWSNFKRNLRDRLKTAATSLADAYRTGTETSGKKLPNVVDVPNKPTPQRENILKVSPEVLFIHDKRTGKFYMQPDNPQAEKLIGKERVEVSKDELGDIANSFTIETATASNSTSNSTVSAVSGNVSHNYTGQKANNIQLLISKAKEYGITNPNSLVGILSVIGKETHFIPKNERMVYSKERLPEVWSVFSKTGKRVKKGHGKHNYNDLAVEYAGNDQKLANFVYQEMRHPSSPHYHWSGTKDRRYGNTQPGDGYKYRGRGFNQVTFKSSYEKYAKETGIDLVNNPDLLNDVNVAADVAVKFLLNRLKQKGIDPNSFTDKQAAINTFAAANAGWGKSPNKAIASANKIAPNFGITNNNMA